MIFQKDIAVKSVKRVAEQLMNAAMTAPKTQGVNNLFIAYAEQEECRQIAQKMAAMTNDEGYPAYFERDSHDVAICAGMILIGSRYRPLGDTRCGVCGFPNCAAKPKEAPCAFNTIDMGIALGSVVSGLSDAHIDNRILNSAGSAARVLGLMPEADMVLAVPLDVRHKNHFYDRTEKSPSHKFRYPAKE